MIPGRVRSTRTDASSTGGAGELVGVAALVPVPVAEAPKVPDAVAVASDVGVDGGVDSGVLEGVSVRAAVRDRDVDGVPV